MRFIAKFTPVIKIILWIMIALSTVGTVIAILVFCKVPIEITTGQATLLISVCPATIIIAGLLTTIHYRIDDTNLRLYFAFFDLFGGKVKINKILNIVTRGDKMYISYLFAGVDPIIASIAISPKKFKLFKDILLSKNENIIYFDDKDETDNRKQ